MKTLICGLCAAIVGCCPAPDCQELEPGDGGLFPVELSCAQIDEHGQPVLGPDGRPVAKPDGSPCCRGAEEGTCRENECIVKELVPDKP